MHNFLFNQASQLKINSYLQWQPTPTTTLGQLCTALWDSQSRPDVIQPEFEPGTVVMPLALRCSALDRCPTQEPVTSKLMSLFNLHLVCGMCVSRAFQTVVKGPFYGKICLFFMIVFCFSCSVLYNYVYFIVHMNV